MKKNIYWFTFVELVIVISIIAILSTISFTSYVSYTSKARDTNRVSQITWIYNSLESYRLKWYLPEPTDKIQIKSSWALIWYQWYAWEAVLNKIWYQDNWKDPSDDKYFTYFISSDMRNEQLLALLENDPKDDNETTMRVENWDLRIEDWKKMEIANVLPTFVNETRWILSTYSNINSQLSVFPKAYATDYSSRIPTTYWKKLWVLLDSSNSPVQELTLLKSSWLDITTTTWSYNAFFWLNNKISWTWISLKVIQWTISAWWVFPSCKDYLEKNKSLYWLDWNYIINPNWTWAFQAYCDMTTEWWWRTKVSYSVWWNFIDVIQAIDNNSLNEMYYSYVRINNYSQKYAFKFIRLWTKQCWIEHWSLTNLSKGVQDYIWHILQTSSWWTCDRIDTPWDANDIQVQKIIWWVYWNDACLNWSLRKNDARNYWRWQPITFNWRTLWSHQHRISDTTVLFWPRGEVSWRCWWSSSWPWVDNVSLFVR